MKQPFRIILILIFIALTILILSIKFPYSGYKQTQGYDLIGITIIMPIIFILAGIGLVYASEKSYKTNSTLNSMEGPFYKEMNPLFFKIIGCVLENQE